MMGRCRRGMRSQQSSKQTLHHGCHSPPPHSLCHTSSPCLTRPRQGSLLVSQGPPRKAEETIENGSFADRHVELQ